jgi:hypothetical protein
VQKNKQKYIPFKRDLKFKSISKVYLSARNCRFVGQSNQTICQPNTEIYGITEIIHEVSTQFLYSFSHPLSLQSAARSGYGECIPIRKQQVEHLDSLGRMFHRSGKDLL